MDSLGPASQGTQFRTGYSGYLRWVRGDSTPLFQGSGLCVLPAFIAFQLPDARSGGGRQVSFTRSYHMHIHEDHRRAAPVGEVAAFIVAEVERNNSLFHEPTARPVASPGDMHQNTRTNDCSCASTLEMLRVGLENGNFRHCAWSTRFWLPNGLIGG